MSSFKKVFYVSKPKKEGAKSFWHQVGVAFVNKDDSLSLKFDLPLAIPEGGQLIVQNPKSKEDNGDVFE